MDLEEHIHRIFMEESRKVQEETIRRIKSRLELLGVKYTEPEEIVLAVISNVHSKVYTMPVGNVEI